VRWTNWCPLFGWLVSERSGALAAEGGLRDNVIATGGASSISTGSEKKV
jgi:hypothetical protein